MSSEGSFTNVESIAATRNRPSYTATPMSLRPEVAEQAKKFEADTPVGGMARVDELVGPAIFLSSQAASFCTGAGPVIDGGFLCWQGRGFGPLPFG